MLLELRCFLSTIKAKSSLSSNKNKTLKKIDINMTQTGPAFFIDFLFGQLLYPAQ